MLNDEGPKMILAGMDPVIVEAFQHSTFNIQPYFPVIALTKPFADPCSLDKLAASSIFF